MTGLEKLTGTKIVPIGTATKLDKATVTTLVDGIGLITRVGTTDGTFSYEMITIDGYDEIVMI
jgi:hypothetical protein